jgi:SAM-dependent methyltransferase
MSEPAAGLAAAFDAEAPGYDAGFGRNPIGLYFRHVVQERARVVFSARSRVLELGCGTGEDALYLAGLGHQVCALDVAPAMVERARAKARARGAPAGLRFEVRAAEDVAGLGGPFDAVFSNFGALNGADLRRVGRALLAVLRPGASLLVSLVGRSPLPALLVEALTARPARSPGSPRVAGVAVPCPPLSFRAFRDGMGHGYTWDTRAALGVLVPAPAHEAWARRNPIAFGVLAAAERLVRSWPVFRGLGDHLLIEGRRP